jgi:tetratricopeptide (TPR) repeat protein
VQLATDAARVVPNNPRIQLTLIQSQVAAGQLDRAQQTAAGLLKRMPNHTLAHSAAGSVALARGELTAARRAFARAIELDSHNVDAVHGLSRVDLAEKRPADAVARVSGLLQQRPNDPLALDVSSRIYLAAGATQDAERALERLIEVEPSHLDAYGRLGHLYASQRRLPEARRSFEAVLKDRPQDVGVQTLVAMLYEAEGKVDEARARYERVLQLDASAAVAANNLAYRYAEDGGNLDVALQLAQTARQRMPDNAEVSDTLGWVFVKRDMASLAIPHLEHAIATRPEVALYHYHLGVALHQTGQKIRSRQLLERALSLRLPEAEASRARAMLAEAA